MGREIKFLTELNFEPMRPSDLPISQSEMSKCTLFPLKKEFWMKMIVEGNGLKRKTVMKTEVEINDTLA